MFSPIETSRDLGTPVNLYLFRYGSNETDYYGYTDAEQPLTIAGYSYTPVPVDRGEVVAAGDLDNSTLQVRVQQDLPLANLFKGSPPSQVVTVTIYQGHVDDPDLQFLVAWSGRIVSCTIEENIATLACQPASTAMRRIGLKRMYQRGCPLLLFGPECSASEAAATQTFTLFNVIGANIVLPVGWATYEAAKRYANGKATFVVSGQKIVRSIIQVIDDRTLLLASSVPGLTAGAAATLTYGCNHQMSDCRDLHNNINNYGGQDWIPYKNPFGLVNNYT